MITSSYHDLFFAVGCSWVSLRKRAPSEYLCIYTLPEKSICYEFTDCCLFFASIMFIEEGKFVSLTLCGLNPQIVVICYL